MADRAGTTVDLQLAPPPARSWKWAYVMTNPTYPARHLLTSLTEFNFKKLL